MRVSVDWLREWLDLDAAGVSDANAVAEQLTRIGLEVDFVEPAAPALAKIYVADVVSAEPHPQADRLRLCKVDAGPEATPDGPVDVVCGAPNARAGMRAALAVPGAKLPDGTKLRRSKIRGVVSNGMLCSVAELGLGEEHDGILELHPDAAIGDSLEDYLRLHDHVIEIDITPNRGDCLGMIGVARDLAASLDVPVTGPSLAPVAATVGDTFDVALESPQTCPYFASRVLRGVDTNAPTPDWIAERLRRAGVRSISLVVDVTNYVMLELNQPMHAYDLAKLEGGIRVRHATAGEKVLLLDGSEPTLDAQTLVIADHSRALGIGGVMGGELSGVSASTRDVLLECAWFDPRETGVTSRRLGLLTDAAHRFARGMDTRGQVRAIERATALILGVGGGLAGPVCEALDDARRPSPVVIGLRRERIRRLLGMAPPDSQVHTFLERLGCEVGEAGDGWQVLPPSWRSDLAIEADLIEEVARLHGYDALPVAGMQAALAVKPATETATPLAQARQRLVERGYHEAVTYAFVSPELQTALEPDTPALSLANAMSSEMAVMRTTLLPGLLGALRHNLNRQQTRVRLFEAGVVFAGRDGDAFDAIAQTPMLAGVACGAASTEQWGAPARAMDFFDAKADVEALLAARAGAEASFVAGTHAAMHPGQCAAVHIGGEHVGWLGALHPRHAETLDLDAAVFVFELKQSPLLVRALPAASGVSRYPAVRRDLAVVVDEAVGAGALLDFVAGSRSDVLHNFVLFDVYRGKGIDSGRKSLAFGLSFRHRERTLADDEVDSEVERLLAGLSARFGATRR